MFTENFTGYVTPKKEGQRGFISCKLIVNRMYYQTALQYLAYSAFSVAFIYVFASNRWKTDDRQENVLDEDEEELRRATEVGSHFDLILLSILGKNKISKTSYNI
jgi:hypothetical protein